MTPEQFAYWLQGYSEIAGEKPTKEQWEIIQDHLQLVFCKVTPDYKYDPSKEIYHNPAIPTYMEPTPTALWPEWKPGAVIC